MRPGTAVFFACAFMWFMSALFLLGYSFDTLKPLEMGLRYNDNTLYLHTDKLYNQEEGDSGRWFTGLGQSFIEFPRQIQTVKFNSEKDADGPTVSAKTFNGTTIRLDLSFQFLLKRTPADVTNLYLTFGTDYKSFYVKYARQVVRDVVSDHFVFDLWEKRHEMGEAMRVALDTKLQQRYASVVGLQVLSLTIPQDIQDAIETTSVAFQSISKAGFEKQAETVRAETRRLVAEKTSEALVLRAEATAETTLLNVNATATAREYTLQKEADTFSHIKTLFNFTNSEVLKYAWLDSMIETPAQAVTLSITQPSVTQLP